LESMRTLGQLLGDPFFDLLEASAAEGRRSVRFLADSLAAQSIDLESLAAIRRSRDGIAAEIDARLARTVMASLKKDEIETLSRSLQRIPESVERVAERLDLSRAKLVPTEFAAVTTAIGHLVDVLVSMVGQLRRFENITATRPMIAQFHNLEDQAEKLTEALLEEYYRREKDSLKLVIVKDVVERINDTIDLCGECAEAVEKVVLKYA
jgi:uncharacterized protein Yka (UPF0111/DUF47 family)